MKHKIQIYVPSTTNVSEVLDNDKAAIYVDRSLRFLSEEFGGATAIPAQGAWVANNGLLVKESITLVYAFTDELTVDGRKKVLAFCETLRNELEQEAIAVEINGELSFI